jgi:hypothetical protein
VENVYVEITSLILNTFQVVALAYIAVLAKQAGS